MKTNTTLCAIAVSTGMLASSGAFAQTTLKPPSLLQQGVSAAAMGRCQTDLLDADLQRSAAVLAAFAPDVATRLVPGPDERAEVALMCSQQLHQLRCSAKIVAVAGDVLTAQQPGGKAIPPGPNPGAVVVGTAAGLTGLLLGTRRDGLGTGVRDGAVGGYAGYQGGSMWWNAQLMKSCIQRQATLDTLSSKLQGSVNVLSMASLTALIDMNITGRILTQQEGSTLVSEANKLATKAIEVLQAAR